VLGTEVVMLFKDVKWDLANAHAISGGCYLAEQSWAKSLEFGKRARKQIYVYCI